MAGFDVGAWDYGAWGGSGFGRKDIDAARGQGASEYQLRQLYQRAGLLGIKREGKHAQEIQKNAPISKWNYGGYGNWGFGMKDVDAMNGTLDQIKEARDWAIQNGLDIGSGVRGHIQGLEQQALDAQLLQQQEQLAQEQNELMAQLAAEEQAAMQAAAEGAEAGRLASMRGGGSRTLSASGAATFKDKGLKSSENKRGKGRGTGQLKRPYGASNLSIAATGKGNQQSTLNL